MNDFDLPSADDRMTELHALATASLEGEMSDEEVVRLEQLVRENEDLRKLYVRYMYTSWNLRTWAKYPLADPQPGELRNPGTDPFFSAGTGPFFGEKTVFAEKTSSENMDLSPSGASISPTTSLPPSFLGGAWQNTADYLSNHEFFTGYLVATVFFLIAAFVGLNVYVSTSVPRQYATQSPETPRTPRQLYLHETEQERIVSIARITGMIDCVWKNANDAPFHDRVVQGTKFMLKSGLMEITYHTGARVILQGPCTYEADSTAGGYLSLGKLTARVESRSRLPSGTQPTDRDAPKSRPAGGTYFAVRTPTAIVTDLGTEFGVEVDGKSGETFAHVYQGKVSLVGQPPDGRPSGRAMTLGENQSARVARREKAVEIVEVAESAGKASNAARFVRADCMKEVPLKPFRQWQAFSEEVCKRNDLVAYYNFEPDTKDRTVLRNRAATGPAFDGKIEGSEWVAGRVNGKHALKFGWLRDGVRVNIPVACRQMTLVAWVRMEAVVDISSLLMSNGWAWSGKGTGKVEFLLMPDNVLVFGHCDAIGAYDVKSPSAPTGFLENQWRMIAVAIDVPARQVVFSLDGKVLTQTRLEENIKSDMNIGPAMIGRWDYQSDTPVAGNDRCLRGCVDEMMIFRKSLSAEEILQLFSAANPRALSVTSTKPPQGDKSRKGG